MCGILLPAMLAFANPAPAVHGRYVEARPCDGEACAVLRAGDVKLSTRCIDVDHDKACGNETTLYAPLARGVSAKAAMTTEHCFSGKALDETWNDHGRRGAFVGCFAVR